MEDKQGAYLFSSAHFWLLVCILFLSASPKACFRPSNRDLFHGLNRIHFAVLPHLYNMPYYVPSVTQGEPAVILLLCGLSPNLSLTSLSLETSRPSDKHLQLRGPDLGFTGPFCKHPRFNQSICFPFFFQIYKRQLLLTIAISTTRLCFSFCFSQF